MKWPTLVLGIIWISFGITYLLRYLYWQGWSWNWNLFGNFATWILAGGIFFIFWQIMEARHSTNAQLAVEFFQRLKDKKDTLRQIYKLGPEDIKLISKNSNWGVDNLNKNKIDSVLDMFNMIGGLRKQGILDKSLAIGIIAGAPALRCWYKLNGYVKEERCKRGYVLEYYEDFTRECLDYFCDRHIEVNFYEERADGTIISKVNLVEKLKLDPSLRPRSLKEIHQERDC